MKGNRLNPDNFVNRWSNRNWEWYTPLHVIDAARGALGSIDLDPASSAEANEVVGAERYYAPPQNGADLPWQGRVWCNPPWGAGAMAQFVARCIEHDAPTLLLMPATTGFAFRGAVRYADIICWAPTVFGWWGPDVAENHLAPPPVRLCPIVIAGFRVDAARFHRCFRSIGDCTVPHRSS